MTDFMTYKHNLGKFAKDLCKLTGAIGVELTSCTLSETADGRRRLLTVTGKTLNPPIPFGFNHVVEPDAMFNHLAGRFLFMFYMCAVVLQKNFVVEVENALLGSEYRKEGQLHLALAMSALDARISAVEDKAFEEKELVAQYTLVAFRISNEIQDELVKRAEAIAKAEIAELSK